VSEDLHDFDDLPEGDGILILSPEKVILSATLQSERLLRRRLNPGQVLPLAEIFPELYLPYAEFAVQQTLKSGITRSHLLTQICLESGLTQFLKYSVSPL
jgi:hypothetical protein